ncbi:MAG: HD-GYP domain-containing protein [Deltaproteobacteria bacterium]|nr:HD-GYP domain-containing protein [Deltaproteobacteria bacterium]
MIQKIDIDDLQAGMHICGLKNRSGASSFFMNNTLIKNAEEVASLKKKGFTAAYINIESVKTRPSARTEPGGGVAAGSEGPRTVELDNILREAPAQDADAKPAEPVEAQTFTLKDPLDIKDEVGFREEIKEARGIRDEAESTVTTIMHDVRMGKSLVKERMEKTVDNIVRSIFRNRDAITSLANLKRYDAYTFTHCVNVSILSIALGRHLGLRREDLFKLGVGAILHDIGKMLIPEGLLNKPGAYNETELSLMKQHALLSADFLAAARFIALASIHVAGEHHERYDGSGYPAGLAGEKIHFFARIAGIADVYDAMTSNRIYQKAIMPTDTLKFMYTRRKIHFGPELVEKFIQCMGIYPIGSLVELSSGDIGLIKSVNRSDLIHPMVSVVLDRHKRPCRRPLDIDLATENKRRIIKAVDPEIYAVTVESINP